jgi:hypothetical protein
VSGVRKQSHRVADDAVNRLKANESDIQACPDGEGEPEVARTVQMVVVVMVTVSVHSLIAAALWAQD